MEECFSPLWTVFQSTLSMRRATRPPDVTAHIIYISIHALHEESDAVHTRHTRILLISIHALHEESDSEALSYIDNLIISIHALHEESDKVITFGGVPFLDFNPRSP